MVSIFVYLKTMNYWLILVHITRFNIRSENMKQKKNPFQLIDDHILNGNQSVKHLFNPITITKILVNLMRGIEETVAYNFDYKVLIYQSVHQRHHHIQLKAFDMHYFY